MTFIILNLRFIHFTSALQSSSSIHSLLEQIIELLSECLVRLASHYGVDVLNAHMSWDFLQDLDLRLLLFGLAWLEHEVERLQVRALLRKALY